MLAPIAPPVFSHVGIFVHDFELMSRFYLRMLGYAVTDRGSMLVPGSDPPRSQQLLFLSNDPTEHHQVILVSGRPADLGFNVINQMSFRVGSLDDLRGILARVQDEPVSDVQPVTHGNAWSLYLRDPEGNRLEFYLPTPWYIQQPYRESMDLAQSDAQIEHDTEARCRAEPGFCTREQWVRKMRAQMSQR